MLTGLAAGQLGRKCPTRGPPPRKGAFVDMEFLSVSEYGYNGDNAAHLHHKRPSFSTRACDSGLVNPKRGGGGVGRGRGAREGRKIK